MKNWVLPMLGAMATACAAEKVSLTLRQAVDIALAPEGNARIRLVELAVQQGRQKEAQVRAALLPNVDSAVTGQNFTRNLRAFGIAFPAVPGLGMPEIVGPISNFDARATASWTVFDFSAWKRLGAAKLAAEAAKAEVEAAKNSLADAVARAYVGALRADAALEVAQANIRLAETLRKLALDQKEAGTGTGIEVLRTEVQAANERQRATLLENERRRSYLQLKRLLNLALDNDIELSDTLAMPETAIPPLEEAMQAALAQRKDLSAQTLREQLSKRSYEAVKWERLPSVHAFGDVGTIGLDIGSSMLTRTYGATLRVPLFDGGRRDARREEAALQARQERVRTEDLRKQMELDVRLALDAMASSRKQVEVAGEGVQLAERELAQAQRRYAAGVTTNVEVVDAQARTERARDNRIFALFQYNQARIDLASAMGAIHRILR